MAGIETMPLIGKPVRIVRVNLSSPLANEHAKVKADGSYEIMVMTEGNGYVITDMPDDATGNPFNLKVHVQPGIHEQAVTRRLGQGFEGKHFDQLILTGMPAIKVPVTNADQFMELEIWLDPTEDQ